MSADPITHTTRPIVTGTSVIALKTKTFVIMAADTLGSYGSLAKFHDIRRIRKVGDSSIVGAAGDISDFQQVTQYLEELETENFCYDDGVTLKAKDIHSYLTRVCYNRRSKVDPYYNSFIIGGFSNGEPYLGYTDLYGTTFKDNYAATSFGLYLGLPLLRKYYDENMTIDRAREVLAQVMKVLFYRDCRTINKVTFAIASKDGVVVEEPRALQTHWDLREINPVKKGHRVIYPNEYAEAESKENDQDIDIKSSVVKPT